MPRILRTPGSRGKRIMGLRLAWDMWTDYIRKKKAEEEKEKKPGMRARTPVIPALKLCSKLEASPSHVRLYLRETVR